MQNLNYEITIPDLDCQLEQNEEWVIVDFGNRQEKVRLHDYSAIYGIPGLYEEILHNRLKCNSPKVICDMLTDILKRSGYNTKELRLLDFGAGNGMAGEQLKKRGCNLIVGVDILIEARNAAYREHPHVYDDYYVMDLSRLNDEEAEQLKQYDFNTLITVGALGFDDIPPRAFLRAFNLMKDDTWIAFNIKDRFLTNNDDTGYKGTMEVIFEDALSVYQKKRYCHRLSTRGEEIKYMAIVGKKIKDVNINEIL